MLALIEQILACPEVSPPPEFPGRSVLVTGAGGSIGSALARTLVVYGEVRTLLLVDNNEFRLYEVHRGMQSIAVPVLASYGQMPLIERLLQEYKVTDVLHVGAYKHVPMVERNPVMAVENNVLAAHRLFDACSRTGVERLTVVSTDKAVRPSSVMGATKAMVEHFARSQPQMEKKVRVVRFGNVLGSSGSVLPLFYEQITQGRPVTITDPEVDRYFMSVGQAVSLILHAHQKPAGVYVLDMGHPVKIVELAERLAYLLGRKFSMMVTGLRPGEKLHEELTLGENLHPTDHPKIKEAREPVFTRTALRAWQEKAEQAVFQHDVGALRDLLQITGYVPVCGIVDDLWLKKYVYGAGDLLEEDCFKDTEEPK